MLSPFLLVRNAEISGEVGRRTLENVSGEIAPADSRPAYCLRVPLQIGRVCEIGWLRAAMNGNCRRARMYTTPALAATLRTQLRPALVMSCVMVRSPATGMAVLATGHVIGRRERRYRHVPGQQQHQAQQRR